MWKSIRYRRLQAGLIGCLTALITACAIFAPLYDREVQQAAASVRIDGKPVWVTGLQVTSRSASQGLALGHRTLEGLVPHSARPYFGPGTNSTTVAVTRLPATPLSLTTTLLWRQAMCSHVRFTAGACPRSPGQIAVSTSDVANDDWRVGQTIRVQERVDDPVLAKTRHAPTAVLRVSGVYALRPGDYWFGTAVTGRSGTSDPDTRAPRDDDWLTARSSLAGTRAPPWVAPSNDVDMALDRERVGTDQLLRLGPVVARFVGLPYRQTARQAILSNGNPPVVVAYSGLPDVAEALAEDRDQAHAIIPLLLVQLGLLAFVVLWLVLDAALEQRRPEIAVARLRGRTVAGAGRMVLLELAMVMLAGVPVGCVAGLALSFAARHWWLPGHRAFELGSSAPVALAAVVVVLAALAAVAVRRVVREPVSGLLRRVPTRRTGWSLGAFDAVIVAISATAVVAFATGGLHGPIALAAPALLALVAGLVLSHLVMPLAATLGQALVRRGRVGPGVSLLQVVRAPSTRRVLTIVTIATSLFVFSVDALAVGARNRTDAAEQQVGAPVVATVNGNDLASVRAALHQVDPQGRTITPVAVAAPIGAGGATTEAVVPDEFRHIALLPGQRASSIPWSRLSAPAQQAIHVVGSSLRLRIVSALQPLTDTGSVQLSAGLVSDGRPAVIPLTVLRRGDTGTRVVTADVPCHSGCILTALVLSTQSPQRVHGTFTIDSMRGTHTQTDLQGDGTAWTASAPNTQGHMTALTAQSGGLGVTFSVSQSASVSLTHAAIPTRLPAIVSGSLPAGSLGAYFSGFDLQGLARPMVRVASVTRIPGAPRDSNLVNLDVLARQSDPDGLTSISIWFARDDPALVQNVQTALLRKGVTLADTRRVGQVRRDYDESAATWSLQLAVGVGGAALLLAALVLLIVAATTWRLRSRDLAALKMTGVPLLALSTIAVGQQIAPVSLAVVLGAICGVAGAHLTLPTVPLFASAPDVSTLDLSTAWPAAGVAALVALVALVTLGWATGIWLLRHSDLRLLSEEP